MIQIREYTPDDYPLLTGWWAGHGVAPVRADCLPKLGLVAVVADVPAAAVWAYMDNSVSVAFLEWFVTNPTNRPSVSVKALHHLTECAKDCLAALGYTAIHSSCRQHSLSRLLEKSGFVQTDSSVIHLVSIS